MPIYRIGARLYDKIPLFFRKTSFEWFASILCLSSAMAAFVSDDIHSEAVRTSLPYWIVTLWYVSLTFGPVLAMVGMVVQTQVLLPHTLFWKKVEALGLSNIMFVGVIYCLAVAAATKLEGFFAVMLITVLVLTCFVRVLEIYAEIDKFRRDINALRD